MTSRIGSRQNHSSYQNGFYFGQRFFTSANHNSFTSVKEPVERMNFTNLEQSSSLLANALHGASSDQQDDRVRLSTHREGSMANAEKLELTLEFQREAEDSLDPLPSVVSLSVVGAESIQSVNKDMKEDNHLRSSCDVAENRFR